MSIQEDNLDDIIASLIDIDEIDEEETETSGSQPALSGKPVTLTERAAKQVKKIIEQENLSEKLYLRVAVDGGGCAGLSYKLGLDHRTEEDKTFESFDVQIVVNAKHLMYLEGIEIDYPDGLDARGFTFNNPNASDSCGCGTSFAV